jgi:1,4-dihydroxy-2-naphthoate octaprenyltransferase
MLETADGPHDHAHRASWANLRGPSRYLAACVAATRPKSLTAAVIPFAVGTSLACAAGPPRWPHAVPAFAAFVLMQVGCNLVNDACDFTRGADGPRRTGPTRVSQAGVFRPGTVHLFGVLTLALVFVGTEFANRIQWAVVLLAVSSAAAAYAYTGGPYPLGYHALGEATVFFFFGVVAVALARRAHLKPPKCEGARSVTHSETHGVFVPSFGFDMSCVTRDLRHTLFDHDALVAGAQTGALACVLLAVNNLRDLNTDAAANKNTLAVRYGVSFVKAEIDALMALAFLCTWYWWFTRVGVHVSEGSKNVAAEISLKKNWSYASTAPCLAIPLALSVSRRARALEPGHRDCDAVLAAAAALHFAFGGLLALGIWLDARSV